MTGGSYCTNGSQSWTHKLSPCGTQTDFRNGYYSDFMGAKSFRPTTAWGATTPIVDVRGCP